MREAGLVVGRTLELLRAAAVPGATTKGLDEIAEASIRDAGAIPSFLGYQPHPSVPPFAGSICASVNDEIVHGIPGPRELRDGDVISIDCGAILDGWHGDAAITVAVGEVPGRGHRADAGLRGVDVARDRRRAPRRPGERHRARHRDVHPLRGRLRDHRGVRRARHRHRDAPGAARAQLRPARPRPAPPEGPGPGRRADGHPRAPGSPGSWTTTGPSRRPTGRRPPTSSTPSRSPTTARGCSPRSTAAPTGSAGWAPQVARIRL